MNQVGSEWPKWGWNVPSVLDTYLCDNEAVYKNASIPEYQLRNKHLSISYHMIREAVASGACRMANKDTETNIPDLFTKVLPGPRQERLLEIFTY